MKTLDRTANGADFAVLVRGNGFYYAIGRVVGAAIEARRRRNAIRHTAEHLDQLPDYLKADIDWPAVGRHEHL